MKLDRRHFAAVRPLRVTVHDHGGERDAAEVGTQQDHGVQTAAHQTDGEAQEDRERDKGRCLGSNWQPYRKGVADGHVAIESHDREHRMRSACMKVSTEGLNNTVYVNGCSGLWLQ